MVNARHVKSKHCELYFAIHSCLKRCVIEEETLDTHKNSVASQAVTMSPKAFCILINNTYRLKMYTSMSPAPNDCSNCISITRVYV